MSESKGWFCYILECADHSYYVGVATDLADREHEHNSGHGALHTRSRRPVRLVWSRPCAGYGEARALEARLKGWSKKKKRLLVVGSLRLDQGLGQSERQAFTNPTLSATYRTVRGSALNRMVQGSATPGRYPAPPRTGWHRAPPRTVRYVAPPSPA